MHRFLGFLRLLARPYAPFLSAAAAAAAVEDKEEEKAAARVACMAVVETAMDTISEALDDGVSFTIEDVLEELGYAYSEDEVQLCLNWLTNPANDKRMYMVCEYGGYILMEQ